MSSKDVLFLGLDYFGKDIQLTNADDNAPGNVHYIKNRRFQI